MYTLEDDNETSSRYKRDIVNTSPDTSSNAQAADTSARTQPAPAHSVLRWRFLPRQLDSSFRRLTTPTISGTGSQKGALAALTIACIAVFFTALDQTVVVTALPQIITDLQIPFTQLDHAAWIISAYLLGFIVAMPLMGRVSDIYGRRRIFLLCLTIFGTGSLFCALAPWLGQNIDLSFLSSFDAIHLHIDTSSPGLIWLIAARLLQAIGGGAIVPIAMAVAGDFYGKGQRSLVLGIIGAVTEAGGALGPLYGALVVEHLGWQYIFYLNIPLVIALLVGVWLFIPRGKRLHAGIDWLGAILLALALTCLSLGLAQQGTSLSPTTASAQTLQNNPIALVLAAIFLLAFIFVERKVRWPVVELSTFKRLTFSATSLVSLFVGAALIIAMTDIPIFVDTVLQLPVLDSGLALLRLTVMIPFGALLGGWLCSRISCRVTAILGLLFTATGFFLMSRWPIHVVWTQITISTMTAGFGFGLVIAPIGTTAMNSVRPTQAGMSSAIVTALRMVGMMLGLAALTSWALAYFKQLAATFPTLPLTATAAQFASWSKGYAAHLIQSEHIVYSNVFLISMVLCLIAIVPALFLWGHQLAVEEPAPDPALNDAPTIAIIADESRSIALAEQESSAPTLSTIPSEDDTRQHGSSNRRRSPRRRLLMLACIGLIVLLISGGILAAFMFGGSSSPDSSSITNGNATTNSGTATPIAGPRMIQLALDKGALTSIFTQQLNIQQGTLTDLSVVPLPNDGLQLSLNLHIDLNTYHRVLPVELDGVIGLDQQQNLQLRILHVRRDGLDAGPAVAANMQTAINQMLANAIMPALHNQLKGVKFISAHTSTSIACDKGAEMLVLQIEAPPIQGIAAQPTPIPFCFSGQINLAKLVP